MSNGYDVVKVGFESCSTHKIDTASSDLDNVQCTCCMVGQPTLRIYREVYRQYLGNCKQ